MNTKVLGPSGHALDADEDARTRVDAGGEWSEDKVSVALCDTSHLEQALQLLFCRDVDAWYAAGVL